MSWLSPDKVRRVTVVGEKKTAVCDDMSDNERVRVHDRDDEAASGPAQRRRACDHVGR